MKKFIGLLLVFMICAGAFSLSSIEEGRKTITASIIEGEIPSSNRIDRDYFIDDFVFPYKIKAEEPLSVFVQQAKSAVYANGDVNYIQVSMKANNREFFAQKDVNYVIYLTNPAFLNTEKGKVAVQNALNRILENKSAASRLCIYVPTTENFGFVVDSDAAKRILDSISECEKAPQIEVVLNKIAQQVQINANGLSWQVLCISDQDIFESKAVREAFVQLPLIYDSVKVSFAYLGYGSSSDWVELNKMLSETRGAIYYQNTYKALENQIYLAFDKFAHDEIENIKVKISYAPWISKEDSSVSISELPYDGHKIILRKIEIPSSFKVKVEDPENVTYATVSVSYNLASDKSKVVYKSYPLAFKFSSDSEEIKSGTNEVITQFRILDNCPEVYYEVERLCNEKNYAGALQVIDNQIKEMQPLLASAKDKKIETEVQNFKNLKKNIVAKIEASAPKEE